MESTLSDLQGWRVIGPRIFDLYDFYQSPDGMRLAVVHQQDEDVVLIMDHDTGYAEYIHPTTQRGLERMGLTVPQFIKMLKAAWSED